MSPSDSGALRRRSRASRADVGRGAREPGGDGLRLKFHRHSQYARARPEGQAAAGPGDGGLLTCRHVERRDPHAHALRVGRRGGDVPRAGDGRGLPLGAGCPVLPLGKDFGWSHALIGGAVSVNLVVYGLGAPFAAAIVERFGVRRVTTFALCQVAVGAGLSVFMNQPWQLYLLWGVVIGSATGALAVPLAAIIANSWFSTRRGLVSGLLTASNASGQLIFLPLLAWIATTYWWQWVAGAVVIAAVAS